MNFNENIGEQILKKINNKGWNVYELEDGTAENPDEEKTIRENLVHKVKRNMSYRVYPIVKKPDNPKKVLKKLEKITSDLKYKPKIKIENYRGDISVDDFVGFTTFHSFVNVHRYPDVLVIPYDSFIQGLDSVVQTEKSKKIDFSTIYDVIMGAGFIGACAYVGHRFGGMKLNPEIVKYLGAYPEFFIGAAGTRIADWGLEKFVGLKNYFSRIALGAAGILTAGILHELGPYGLNDPSDVAKYAVGIGLSAIVGALYNKKKK